MVKRVPLFIKTNNEVVEVMSTVNGQSTGIPYWVKLTIVFFLGWVVVYATRTIISPLLGNMESAYGLSGLGQGAVMSLFYLGYMFMNGPCGLLGDVIGKKTVLVVGVLGFGILTMISGTMTTYSAFIFCWVLVGMFQGFFYGPQYGLSSEVIPKKHLTLGSAIINSGMAFGLSLGLYISTFSISTLKLDWHMPFFIVGAMTILVGLVMLWVVKSKPPVASDTLFTANTEKTKLTFKELFGNHNINMCYIIIFSVMFGFFLLVTWLPDYLEQAKGIKGNNIATVASLIPWFAIPGSLFFSWVCDRLGSQKPVLLFMMPLSLIAVIAVPLSSSMNVLIVALIVYGLVGKVSTNPVLVAIVAKNAPQNTLSTSFGVYNCLGMIGSSLAPIVTGWLKQHGGYDLSFYLAGALIGVGIIASLMIKTDKD